MQVFEAQVIEVSHPTFEELKTKLTDAFKTDDTINTGLYIFKLRPEAAPRLTHQQTEVRNLIVKGMMNKEIGDALGLSEKTVKAHATAIYRVYEVRSRGQLILKVMGEG